MNLALEIMLGLFSGAAIGAAQVGTLAWTVDRVIEGRAFAAFSLQVLRLALIAGLMLGLARLGSGVLVSAAIALLATRHILVRLSARGRA